MFYPVDDLKDDVILLQLDHTCDVQPEKRWLPAYYFNICLLDGTKVGYCDLRIGHNDKTYIGGNIGYGIDEAWRGHHYAARACALLKALAPSLGQRELFIAVRPFNLASKRTCELLKAEPCAEVPIPQGDPLYRSDQPYMLCYKLL